ncbi:MAG: FimV/HubP family polar landmark protein [Pseudomonadota bacterium]
MVRKLVVIFTSVVLFTAAHAKALGLGEITIDSALNQPLAARIELLQLGGVNLDQITVQLASENDFERFSIDREGFLGAIRFDIESAGTGAYVHLTTVDPVREPYLSFVLETSWPSGRLLSEHTVLLDLPAFAGNATTVAIQQPVQTASSANSSSVNQQVDSQTSGVVPAPSMRLAAPTDPVSPPADSDAVLASDADNDDVVQPAADVLAAPAPAQSAPASAPTSTSVPLANNQDASSDSVTIGADDTLWDVAMQVRPDSSVSVQQTMLALQRLNSEAFIADNINMVRRGQVLRIPDIEQIRSLSTREAMSEVSRQNQLFENRRNVPLSSQPVSAAPSQAPADAANGRGELSVVSIDADEPATPSVSGGQSAELDARIAALENELAVQLEEADRVARQNAELQARLSLLEEQIVSAQEIIRLRDLELAQLQQTLAQTPDAVTPEPVDPPTVITMAPPKSFVQTLLDTLIENTFALLAVVGLLILIIVYALLRRNRSAEQENFADLDDIQESEQATDKPAASQTVAGSAGIVGNAMVADIDPDLQDIFNIEDSDEVDMPQHRHSMGNGPDAGAVEELLEEADALLAYERYDEAASLLQDAIVAEPERADLRLKLLEVCAARQDVIGFKLQETELRDLGDLSVMPRIAELKAQLRGEVDHDALEDISDELIDQDALQETLDDGEDIFLAELDAMDDMELSLDLEAAATVDDDLVRSGYSVDAPSKSAETTLASAAIAGAVAASVTEPDEDDRLLEFSSAFDLSDDEEITAEPANSDLASAAVAEEVESSLADENLLDFDFDFAVEDAPADTVEPAQQVQEPELSEDDPDHSIDFDFAMLIDDEDAKTTANTAVDAGEDVTDESGMASVVEADNSLEFEFDTSQFDIGAVDVDEEIAEIAVETAVETEIASDDDFDDLQFVDDSLLAEKSAQEDESGDDDILEFLADTDEAATKLDLAQAYYEMGDYEGAREILEEVVSEGNEEQIKDAQRLLAKI